MKYTPFANYSKLCGELHPEGFSSRLLLLIRYLRLLIVMSCPEIYLRRVDAFWGKRSTRGREIGQNDVRPFCWTV